MHKCTQSRVEVKLQMVIRPDIMQPTLCHTGDMHQVPTCSKIPSKQPLYQVEPNYTRDIDGNGANGQGVPISNRCKMKAIILETPRISQQAG